MENAENVFMAGYAEQIITPDFPVGLTGYGNEKTRISTGKLNDLYVCVLAARDPDGNTAVMICVDTMTTLVIMPWTWQTGRKQKQVFLLPM